MSLHIDALHNGDSEYVTAVSEIKEVLRKRGREPLHWYDFVFDNFLSVGRKTNRLIRLTHEFTDKVFMIVVIIVLRPSNTPETSVIFHIPETVPYRIHTQTYPCI